MQRMNFVASTDPLWRSGSSVEIVRRVVTVIFLAACCIHPLLTGNVVGDAALSACNASALSNASSTVAHFHDCVINDTDSWASVVVPTLPLVVTSVMFEDVVVNVAVGLSLAAGYPGTTTTLVLNFNKVAVNAPLTISEVPLITLAITGSEVHSTISLVSSSISATVQPTIVIASTNVTTNRAVAIVADTIIAKPQILAEFVRHTTTESIATVPGTTALVFLSSVDIRDLSFEVRHSTFDLVYGHDHVGAFILLATATHFNGTTLCHVNHVNFTANLSVPGTQSKTVYSAAAISVLPISSISHTNFTIADSAFVAHVNTMEKRSSQAFVVWLDKPSLFSVVSYVGYVYAALHRVVVDFQSSLRSAVVIIELGVMSTDSPFLQMTAHHSQFSLEVLGNIPTTTFLDLASGDLAGLVNNYVLARSGYVFEADRLVRAAPARFELHACVVSAFVWTDYDEAATTNPTLTNPFQNLLLMSSNAAIVCSNATELTVEIVNSTFDFRVIQRAAQYVYMSFGSFSAVVCLLSTVEATRLDLRLDTLSVHVEYNVTPKPPDATIMATLTRMGFTMRGFGSVATTSAVVIIDSPTICSDSVLLPIASSPPWIRLRGVTFSQRVPPTMASTLDASRGGLGAGLIFFAAFDKDFRLLGLTSVVSEAIAALAFPSTASRKAVCHVRIRIEDVLHDLTEAASVLYLPPATDKYRRYVFMFCAALVMHETAFFNVSLDLSNVSFRLPTDSVVGLPASTCLASDRASAPMVLGNASVTSSTFRFRNLNWTTLPRSQPLVYSVNASWTDNNITVETVENSKMGQLCLPKPPVGGGGGDVEGPWSLLRRDLLSTFRRTNWEISNVALSSAANGTLFPLSFASTSNWLGASNRVDLQCILWNGAVMPPSLFGVGDDDAVEGTAACGSVDAPLRAYASQISASSLTAAGVIAAASATGIVGTSLPLQLQKSLAALNIMLACGTSSFDDEAAAPGFAMTDNPLQIHFPTLDSVAVWLPWSVGAILGNVVVVVAFSVLVFVARFGRVWHIATSLLPSHGDDCSGGGGHDWPTTDFQVVDVLVVTVATCGLPVAAWPVYGFVVQPTFYAAATVLWQAVSPSTRDTSFETSTAGVVGVGVLATATLVICVMPLLYGGWRWIPRKRLDVSLQYVKTSRRGGDPMVVPKRGRSRAMTRLLRRLARTLTWLFSSSHRWTTAARNRSTEEGRAEANLTNLTTWLPLIEPYRSGYHWFFAVDLGQSLVVAVLTTCSAMVGTPSSCLAIQWANLGISVVVFAMVAVWRPFQTNFDLLATGSAYLLTSLVAIGGVIDSIDLAAVAALVQAILGASTLVLPALAALMSQTRLLNLSHLRNVSTVTGSRKGEMKSSNSPCERMLRARLGLEVDPSSAGASAQLASRDEDKEGTKITGEGGRALVPLGSFVTSVAAQSSFFTIDARLTYLVQRVCRNERRRAMARAARRNDGNRSNGSGREVQGLDEVFLLPQDSESAVAE